YVPCWAVEILKQSGSSDVILCQTSHPSSQKSKPDEPGTTFDAEPQQRLLAERGKRHVAQNLPRSKPTIAGADILRGGSSTSRVERRGHLPITALRPTRLHRPARSNNASVCPRRT